MDFKLTDEQELMLENLREFCDRWVTEERIEQWYKDRRVDDEVDVYKRQEEGRKGVEE